MNNKQFAAFMTAFQQGMTALIPAPNNNTNSKISVKIPTFKGAPKNNVMTWMLQVQNLFKAQGIEEDDKKNLLCYNRIRRRCPSLVLE
jgi:hypothetical protein